jgi:pimeloyl-ACP methyl ester carboxylesterase
MSEFGALKQIEAGVLNVSYAEAGPTDGLPVLLLHGWPYDIYSYVELAPGAQYNDLLIMKEK